MSSAKVAAESVPVPLSVLFERPPIPCLWLDTSVVIKLAKVIQGEKLSEIEVRRGAQLRAIVLELVKEGKLICPLSEQEEEIEGGRLDGEVLAEFARLSRGVRMNHRSLVQEAQIYRSMTAFCRGERTVTLPWRIYFHEDPMRIIARETGRRFVISVSTPSDHPIVERRRSTKREIVEHTESLRRELRSRGVSFAEQVERESRALATAMAQTLEKFYASLRSGRTEFWQSMAASGFLEYLRYWMGLGQDPKNLFPFLTSEYTTSLPIIRVSAQLYADLVTGNQVVQPGDPGDVDLLSTAIPLAHYVLTDRRMESRIKRLDVDKEWNTKVFSMSTLDGLIAELEALKSSSPSPFVSRSLPAAEC